MAELTATVVIPKQPWGPHGLMVYEVSGVTSGDTDWFATDFQTVLAIVGLQSARQNLVTRAMATVNARSIEAENTSYGDVAVSAASGTKTLQVTVMGDG